MPAAPLTNQDRDAVIRTLAAEAGGEPDIGKAAVASVIKNRMLNGLWGSTARDVVFAPTRFPNYHQFSAWNDPSRGGSNVGRNLQVNSPQYGQLGALVDNVFNGTTPDPTNGALNYYAPRGMPGGRPPAWAQGMTDPMTVGNQVFGTTPVQPDPQGPALPVANWAGTDPFSQPSSLGQTLGSLVFQS